MAGMKCPNCLTPLTDAEVAMLNAKRSARRREYRLKCECGECPTCKGKFAEMAAPTPNSLPAEPENTKRKYVKRSPRWDS